MAIHLDQTQHHRQAPLLVLGVEEGAVFLVLEELEELPLARQQQLHVLVEMLQDMDQVVVEEEEKLLFHLLLL
jgi:hypothetical protein